MMEKKKKKSHPNWTQMRELEDEVSRQLREQTGWRNQCHELVAECKGLKKVVEADGETLDAKAYGVITELEKRVIDNANLEAEVAKLNELIALRDEALAAQRKTIKELEQKNKDLELSLSDWKMQNDTLQQKVKELGKELMKAVNEATDYASLREQKVKELENELAARAKRIEDLIFDKTVMSSKIKDLREKNERLQHRGLWKRIINAKV